MGSNANEGHGQVAALTSQKIDQVIGWASLTPDAILKEYESRGVRMPDGSSFGSIHDVHAHVMAEQAEELARHFVKLYARSAGAQGFVTGLGGLMTLPVTVPADAVAYVAWLARAASGTQLAYGHETRTETGDAQLKLAMLAGAGVSHVTIKGTKVLVSSLAKKTMTTPYSKAPIQAAVKALAAKAGVQLTHKSFAKVIPVIGGVVNGGAQGAMVKAAGDRIVAHYRALATTSEDW